MNPYEILDLPTTATMAEIKIAFRRLSKHHHPDKGGDTETYQQITAAYELLSDPRLREIYDTTGDSSATHDWDSILAQNFEHLVAKACELNAQNIGAFIRDHATSAIAADEDSVRRLTRKIERTERKSKLHTHHGGTFSLIDQAFTNHLSSLRKKLTGLRVSLLLCRDILKVLDTHEFQDDTPDHAPGVYIQGATKSFPGKHSIPTSFG